MSTTRDKPDWLDELYDSASRETPPAELDAQLRAAARGAGKVTPLTRPWFRRPAVLGGLATAATLVLAVSVGLSSLVRSPTPVPAEEPAAVRFDLEDPLAPSRRPGPRATVSTEPFATEAELVDARSRIEEIAVTASFSPDTQARSSADAAASRPGQEQPDRAAPVEEAAAPLEEVEGLAMSKLASGTTAAAPPMESSAASLLLPTLDPGECTSVTLLDVQRGAPYALCRSGTVLELHHADCDVPYALEPGAVVTSVTPGWLSISDGREQIRLRCGPGGWLASAEGAAPEREQSASEDEPDPQDNKQSAEELR